MIYINFGFPKTSSTNLQKNFYPNIKNILYLGRCYHKINSKIYEDINDYIEFRRDFNDKEIKNLRNKFLKKSRKKIVLISNESWLVPYQKNNLNGKIEVVSQFKKLERVKFFFGSKIKVKYFLIQRNRNIAMRSLFVTLEERIYKLFGRESLNFKFFKSRNNKKDKDYKNIKLFFEVYNLKKIQKILGKNKLKTFSYNELKLRPKEFLNNFENYLKIKINRKLIDKIKIRTRVTKKQNSKYVIYQTSFLYEILKKLLPNKILNFLKKISFLKKIRFLFLKKLDV